jgi:hypothetical protein
MASSNSVDYHLFGSFVGSCGTRMSSVSECVCSMCTSIHILSVCGCSGYQGPGGLSNGGDHWDCTGGIHRYIDMKVRNAIRIPRMQ